MRRPLHIVVDSNLPHSIVPELWELWRSSFPGWAIQHEKNIGKWSSLDRHWIVKLQKLDRNRDWLIITKDKGEGDRRDGDKLPRLCKKHDHAYLVIADSLQRSEQIKAAIASVWPDFPYVVQACKKLRRTMRPHVKLNKMDVKAGTGYCLQVADKGIRSFLELPSSSMPDDDFRLSAE